MLTGSLRVAVLSSHRAPGLRDLLADARDSGFYDVVCGVATEEDFADTALYAARGVPFHLHPIRSFYKQRGCRLTDLAPRPAYDREILATIAPYGPDIVLLSSYLYILTEPFLAAYPGRIVNVHGSDLTRLGPDGRPLYPGLRAVRDAIQAGERETYATAHLLTEKLDQGPPLARSHPYPVAPFVSELLARGKTRAVHAYAHAHQEWMLETAWGSLLMDSVRIVGAAREWLPEPQPSAIGAKRP